MACAADRKIDLTICSICFETLKTPKCFPCLHSFCEGCLQTYITTYAQEKGGINCPICRIFVSKPDDISFDEWSTKLPTNHILVSLIDINESELSQKRCASCARKKENESASSWCRNNCKEALCKSCERSHRKNRTTSNHEPVTTGENMSTNKPTDVLCTEHPQKKVDTYCYTHAALCCSSCVMLKHIKCENVCSIEDAAKQKKQSKVVQEFEDKLQDSKKSLEVPIQDRTEHLRNFDADICPLKKEEDHVSKELSKHSRQPKINILSEISMIEKESRKAKYDLRRSADTNVDMITVEPNRTAVTGVALLENSQVVISNNNNNTLELRDPQCNSVLSSLSLPGHPWGIKMINDTGGAVAVQGHGLIIFKIQNNEIVELTENKTYVNFDFAYHRGKYFVRCHEKIELYNRFHHKLHDISVNGKGGYIAVLDDNSLCYTENRNDGCEMHCITMVGNPKFTYSHKELRHIMGVTVDQAGYIYVCDNSSKTVHQLSHDGKLQRIMFKNLPASPYCISFNTRGNKAVIGCNGEILLYDLG